MAQFICEKQGRCCPHEFYDSIEQAISDSEDGVPCDHLIEVSPVRHGRWAIDEFGHYCTVCREYGPETEGDAEIVDLLKYGTPYCPNCGAKMDLEG